MISAIAVRHGHGLAYEVDRTLHVTEAFAGRQVEHPASERTIDTGGVARRLWYRCRDVDAFAHRRNACVCGFPRGLALGCAIHELNSSGGI